MIGAATIAAACAAAAASCLVGLALGWVVGSRRSVPHQAEIEHTEAGEVNIDLRYTCHPERFFRLLERDLAVLDQNDVVDLEVVVKAPQGWDKLKFETNKFPRVYGKVCDAADHIRALLMDDDSPLVWGQQNRRQANFGEIRGWARKTDQGTHLSWRDSDSPLLFRVTGSIQNTSQNDEEPSLEREAIDAVREVDDLVRKHGAALTAARKNGAK